MGSTQSTWELILKRNRDKMLYKFSPMGYFGRVSQISRGPWFAEMQAEDDGLEYYYMHHDS